MRATRPIFSVLLLLLSLTVADLAASGRVGFYGIVEKVVFEPSEQSPQRVQVWGVFAYANTLGGGAEEASASRARRGYLYFKLPDPTDGTVEAARREWMDLKAVAGTGQAIGFGSWGYNGWFTDLDPGARSGSIYELYAGWSAGPRERPDLRVRPVSETPASPATYQTNVGVVKLSDRGSRADVVQQLKAVLRTP